MFLALMALLSLNVNGLRDIDKMNSVFTTIKHKHASITFLQETFWDNDFIERYKHLWEGKIYYNNCPNKNRRGVAILISKECPYKFTFNSCDTEGRILKINTHIDNEEYSFINVYAPNNVEERIQFCNNLKCYIDSKNTILGGDFNEIFDPTTDHGVNTTTFSIRSSNTLLSIVFDFNLIHIWRHRNPDKREFILKLRPQL